MQTGRIKATPISNNVLKNSKTLGKRHSFRESPTAADEHASILKITWKACRLRKLE